jgi:hypothetical protein
MDGRRVAVLPATVNGKFRTFPKGHEKVPEESGPECIIVAKAAQPLQPFLQPALRTPTPTAAAGHRVCSARPGPEPCALPSSSRSRASPTTRSICTSARRFHDGKISGYRSTLPESGATTGEEVNPLEVSLLEHGTLLPTPPWPSIDSARGHLPVAVSLYTCGVIRLAMAPALRLNG